MTINHFQRATSAFPSLLSCTVKTRVFERPRLNIPPAAIHKFHLLLEYLPENQEILGCGPVVCQQAGTAHRAGSSCSWQCCPSRRGVRLSSLCAQELTRLSLPCGAIGTTLSSHSPLQAESPFPGKAGKKHTNQSVEINRKFESPVASGLWVL